MLVQADWIFIGDVSPGGDRPFVLRMGFKDIDEEKRDFPVVLCAELSQVEQESAHWGSANRTGNNRYWHVQRLYHFRQRR